MQDNGAHSFTEAANFTTEEQLKKEEIYLDLSKLSEEERKEVYFLFPKECFNAVKITLYYQYLHLKDWFTSLFNHDKTEISLSQFKELFQTSAEDAEVEITREEFIFNCDMYRQNLNGRETEQEIFRAGIESVIEELKMVFKSNN